jgi:hypothetical protein
LRDFLCQTFFLAEQKDSLTHALATAITVKENGRRLYAGEYAASITRRGDCACPRIGGFTRRRRACPPAGVGRSRRLAGAMTILFFA